MEQPTSTQRQQKRGLRSNNPDINIPEGSRQCRATKLFIKNDEFQAAAVAHLIGVTRNDVNIFFADDDVAHSLREKQTLERQDKYSKLVRLVSMKCGDFSKFQGSLTFSNILKFYIINNMCCRCSYKCWNRCESLKVMLTRTIKTAFVGCSNVIF